MAQITGNLNVKDSMALLIDESRIRLLTGKEWFFVERVEVRGDSMHKRQFQSSLKFDANGVYKEGGQSGTWKAVNQEFIQISKPTNNNFNSLLGGPYSIYEISDSTLVLIKVLTSDGRWTKTYKFSSRIVSIRSNTRAHPMCDEVDDFDGQVTKYFPNGNVEAIENYRKIKRRLSKEQLFILNNEWPECYSKIDSSRDMPVPTGEWIQYFPNGQIRSTRFYDENGTPVKEWRTYLEDGRVGRIYFPDENTDDVYRYPVLAKKPIIERRVSGSPLVFIVGNMDSVQFDRNSIFEFAPVESQVERGVMVFNLTPRTVDLKIIENPKIGVEQGHLHLEPHDIVTLKLRMILPPGKSDENIIISSDEWVFPVSVSSFGYHLDSRDFDKKEKRKLPRKFFIYRTGTEFQLEIVDVKKPSRSRTIPISKRMNEIEVEKGEYLLTLIGSSSKKTLIVEVID